MLDEMRIYYLRRSRFMRDLDASRELDPGELRALEHAADAVFGKLAAFERATNAAHADKRKLD